MNGETPEAIRDAVRDHYGKVAAAKASCCAPSCCAPTTLGSESLGYSKDDLEALPEGADLGLGCGNPSTIAGLAPGETVLDLGAGAGIDCFVAARKVGPTGRVIGVDMTPEMLKRARENARKANVANVDFRLGEIEHLPVADATVDVVLSNCVINLSADKAAVYREAFRVLRPGGRLAISDVVATAEIPEALRAIGAALTGCVAGAASPEDVRGWMQAAGFADVRVDVLEESREMIKAWMPGAEQYVASASITARRPA